MRRRLLFILLGVIALPLTAIAQAETPVDSEASSPTKTPAVTRTAGDHELISPDATPEQLGQVAGEAIGVMDTTEWHPYAPTVRLSIEMVIDWSVVR
ncbi:MAG: hypothetical protein HC838_08140 [Spirulinaceae cyanobacterium RM2_2_10]|nr:hypothetical protein [Spirulinaceae cyanobacterium SM2_1_0]NJO20021.1 hypothetical protein [Spirulinaceae cyanobacterium RM2_2_10]